MRRPDMGDVQPRTSPLVQSADQHAESIDYPFAALTMVNADATTLSRSSPHPG